MVDKTSTEINNFFQKQTGNYGGNYGLLYSAKSQRNSSIFYDELLDLKPKSFDDLEKQLKNNLESKFYGFISYEAKDLIENTSSPLFHHINSPLIWFKSFKKNLQFNGNLEQFFNNRNFARSKIKVKNLESNFTDASYIKTIEKVRQEIIEGNLYQANLTRKYFGFIEGLENPFSLFLDLLKLNPNDYSAFLKFDNLYILSSSPELFLNIDEGGNATSEPIKGTFKKSLLNKKLVENEKERAENLMIVDLVRNDFARSCKVSSVKVDELFKLSEYKNLHHLSSIVSGKLMDDKTNIDLIKACFPAGSMTGTPKIFAMEKCSELENFARGIYSGALGSLKGLKETNLSVVIRTLILEKIGENKFKFELQSGGGITYDSNPKAELEELKIKIAPLFKLLGI